MTDIRVNVRPQHARQLGRMFTRMKAEGDDRARQVTRGELRGLIRPGGTLTDRVIPALLGDVTGTLGANVLTALRGRAVSALAPIAGQALVWSGTAWAPGTASSYWEPIVTGDPDDPQLLFDTDGDILMEEVL